VNNSFEPYFTQIPDIVLAPNDIQSSSGLKLWAEGRYL
jgi:hypothetical protein